MIGREARQLVVAMSVLCIVMPGAPSFAQLVDVWGAAAGGDLETTFQMDLDIERIRKTRPAVRTVLQGAD